MKNVNMRRSLSVLVLLVLLCNMLVGCNTKKENTTNQQEPAGATDPVNLTLDGKEVSEITICSLSNANAGYIDAAILLGDRIYRASGMLPTFSRYNPEKSNQILVCNAKQASRYLPEGIQVDKMQYAICRVGNNIIVVADDEMGAELGVQVITDAIWEANGALELTNLCTAGAIAYTYDQNLTLEHGANCRVMSYNIERTELGGDGRYDYALNNILFYNPDVIGFQEYCVEYNKYLSPKLLDSGYKMVGDEVVTTEGQPPCADRYSMTNNYTPIAYKADKFLLMDSGWERMIPGNFDSYGWPGYSVSWAVLQDRETEEIFAVTTLHNLASSAATAVDTRTEALVKVIELVQNTIVAHYNCPVICVGDYNTNEANADYLSVSNLPDFSDARYVAEWGYSVGNSHGTKGEVLCTGTTEDTIDHIFVRGNVRVIRHRFGHSTEAAKASDHKPVFVDVAIDQSPRKVDKTNPFASYDFTSMHLHAGTA